MLDTHEVSEVGGYEIEAESIVEQKDSKGNVQKRKVYTCLSR